MIEIALEHTYRYTVPEGDPGAGPSYRILDLLSDCACDTPISIGIDKETYDPVKTLCGVDFEEVYLEMDMIKILGADLPVNCMQEIKITTDPVYMLPDGRPIEDIEVYLPYGNRIFNANTRFHVQDISTDHDLVRAVISGIQQAMACANQHNPELLTMYFEEGLFLKEVNLLYRKADGKYQVRIMSSAQDEFFCIDYDDKPQWPTPDPGDGDDGDNP